MVFRPTIQNAYQALFQLADLPHSSSSTVIPSVDRLKRESSVPLLVASSDTTLSHLCTVAGPGDTHYKFTLKFEFSTPGWLNTFRSRTGRYSSSGVHDRHVPKLKTRPVAAVQKVRTQRYHFLTRAKLSLGLDSCRRKIRNWVRKRSPQREACQKWVSQIASHECEDPNYHNAERYHKISGYPINDNIDESHRDNKYLFTYYNEVNEYQSWVEPRIPLLPPVLYLQKRYNTLRPSPIPRRTTSLRSWNQALKIYSLPSTPLSIIKLSQHGRPYFHAVCDASLRIPFRRLALQLSHLAPCICDIVIATAIIRRHNRITSKYDIAARSVATRYYIRSKQELQEHINSITVEADSSTWLTALLATLLYKEFRAAMGHEGSVKMHFDAGLRLAAAAEGELGSVGLTGQVIDVLRTSRRKRGKSATEGMSLK